ncbi:DUF445 domain-containing protein [Bacillus tuaregi]|uniref:DUF445 domain-containing protein n=1 Tax=Bacillus tuaregi TaxID=1816695 RepID=UPI0008F81199|nr:DUF445 domain-containing protein [Bacillus tuaregi]
MSSKKKESKQIALYSLIIMGIGFIATIPFQGTFWVDLLQGGFEAGLVGGLADWFAVTALFRHPLGIPIPHTALLPNNRNRITQALVRTIKRDWLSKESIQEKVQEVPFTEKLIPILNKQVRTEITRKAMINLIQQAIKSIDIEKLTPVVKKQIISVLSTIEVKKILQYISTLLLNEQFDKKALDYLLQKAEVWLNQPQTKYKLGNISMNVLNNVEVDGFLQFAVKSLQSILNEEKLGSIIKNVLISGINSLKHEEDPNREALIQYIQKEIQAINDNHKLIVLLENWRKDALEKWKPDNKITEVLSSLKEKTLEFIVEDSFFDSYLVPIISQVLDYLKVNQSQIDQWIQNQITLFVEKNHSKIGHLVQENLEKLSNDELIDMVENNLGKDLQWIRVNGAVCGFFIGLILTGIHALLRLI